MDPMSLPSLGFLSRIVTGPRKLVSSSLLLLSPLFSALGLPDRLGLAPSKVALNKNTPWQGLPILTGGSSGWRERSETLGESVGVGQLVELGGVDLCLDGTIDIVDGKGNGKGRRHDGEGEESESLEVNHCDKVKWVR